MDITTANRLYELRKQHGYSQDELADMLNVSRQAVSKWERSESSPDTDNLIALAKLYNVSLDELLGFNHEDIKKNSDAENDVNDNKNDDSNADCDKNTDEHVGDHVHIDLNGIHVQDKNGDHVHIDENGIHVKDKNGEQVHITGNIAKLVNKVVGNIHIDDNDDDDDDYSHKDENIKVAIKNAFKGEYKHPAIKGIVFSAMLALCLAAYLAIGFACNLWHPGWLLFFVPMIVDGVVDTIIKRNPSCFPIVFITTGIYLLLGCGWGMWHPYWAIFATIPAYYIIVEPIKHAIDKKSITIEIEQADDIQGDIEEDEEDNNNNNNNED